MSEPDHAFRSFRWQPNWRQIFSCLSTFSAGFLGFGFVLAAASEWMYSVHHWFIIPVVFLGLIAAFLLTMGAFTIGVFTPMYIGRFISKSLPIISMHTDRVWIYDWQMFDLFPKTIIIEYGTIAWVTLEQLNHNRDSILIVHGPDLKTEHVTEIRQTDAEEILAILAERCPAAFTPDPPDGWCPPKQ